MTPEQEANKEARTRLDKCDLILEQLKQARGYRIQVTNRTPNLDAYIAQRTADLEAAAEAAYAPALVERADII